MEGIQLRVSTLRYCGSIAPERERERERVGSRHRGTAVTKLLDFDKVNTYLAYSARASCVSYRRFNL